MPLVFAENEETESGITYADRTGVSYQYPRPYRRIIKPGERFIYYKGRRKRGGGRAPQVYFGVGLVGMTAPDFSRPNHFVCEILDYQPFAIPVPFKNPAGSYLEAGASRRGHFQRGVRVVSEQDFRGILEAAERAGAAPSALATSESPRPTQPDSLGVGRDLFIRRSIVIVVHPSSLSASAAIGRTESPCRAP
jgi:hypothetical protein